MCMSEIAMNNEIDLKPTACCKILNIASDKCMDVWYEEAVPLSLFMSYFNNYCVSGKGPAPALAPTSLNNGGRTIKFFFGAIGNTCIKL